MPLSGTELSSNLQIIYLLAGDRMEKGDSHILLVYVNWSNHYVELMEVPQKVKYTYTI